MRFHEISVQCVIVVIFAHNQIKNETLIFTGRGLKSGENFKLLYDLADKMNAAGEMFLVCKYVVIDCCVFVKLWILNLLIIPLCF